MSLTRIAIVLLGAAEILTAAALSAFAVYRHGREVVAAWQTALLVSPAFWIWVWACWMAVVLPTSLAGKVTPLFGVEEGGRKQLLVMTNAFGIIAAGVAVAWLFLAWGAMPLLPGGAIRWVPFWPWPTGSFTRYVLP